MPEQNELILGALNVVAHPHPDGIYVQILKKVANKEVRIWGSDYAKITTPTPRRSDENIYVGRILVWTEIRKGDPWLDKIKNDEASDEDKSKIVIPDQLEPNFRSFHYALNVRRHRIVLEYQNELSQRFGPTRAVRLFSELFSPKFLGSNGPEVAVTAIPEDASIEIILGIPRLRRLDIYLERPNPDDLTEDAARVLSTLEKQGAKSQNLGLAKARGLKTLKPNEDTKLLAKVAAENGYVEGLGRDEHGDPVSESTKSHPKRVSVLLEAGQSAFAKFISSLGIF